jgi:hypothetical protein
MSLIWLVDYDGKMENLALMRLSAYHKRIGDTVRLKQGDARPELFEMPDRVYISCVFRWNRRYALALADAWGSKAFFGGPGISYSSYLPPEVMNHHINYVHPDYKLYGLDRAIGFISRGCPNSCPWCIVPRKEGELHRVASAEEIVGDKDEVVFLDNNFLALPDFHIDLEWLARQGTRCDFNQGLDARRVDALTARLLAKCNLHTPGGQKVRLACDSRGQIKAVERAVVNLKNVGIGPHSILVYCLIGFSSFESDIERLLFLHSLGVSTFPMGYRDNDTGLEPARGWDWKLYRKYRRLIIRMPFAGSVWDDFRREVAQRA